MVQNGPNGRKWSKWSKMVKNGGPDLKQAQRTGLSVWRAQRTKSRGPKGPQLEVGARRVPRLLVFLYLSVDFWKLQWSGRLWRCKLQQCLEYWALDICILGHLLFLNKRYEIPLTHSIWCDAFHSLILSREGLILILSHFPCPEGWISCSIPVDGCWWGECPHSTKTREVSSEKWEGCGPPPSPLP